MVTAAMVEAVPVRASAHAVPMAVPAAVPLQLKTIIQHGHKMAWLVVTAPQAKLLMPWAYCL